MPSPQLAPSVLAPLSRRELADLLTSLFHDECSSPKIAVEAFTATAMGLYRFCDRDDVDAALLAIPRGLGQIATA